MSLTAGDRVQLHEALGMVEKIREDGITAEVLWDTGARCPLPLDWLSDPEDREAARVAALEEAKERRRLEREQERRELPEQECDGCVRHYIPTRKSQKFHSKSCANRARRLGLV